MAKLFVTGVMEWDVFGPYAFVSVESGAGEGVKGLGPTNFTVGSMGMGASIWTEHSVTDVNPVGGIGKGFYYLSLKAGEPLIGWQPALCNVIFTIEVHTGKRGSGDHGQAIAINKCCDRSAFL